VGPGGPTASGGGFTALFLSESESSSIVLSRYRTTLTPRPGPLLAARSRPSSRSARHKPTALRLTVTHARNTGFPQCGVHKDGGVHVPEFVPETEKQTSTGERGRAENVPIMRLISSLAALASCLVSSQAVSIPTKLIAPGVPPSAARRMSLRGMPLPGVLLRPYGCAAMGRVLISLRFLH
jgi:hypothetical protein